jgi:methyl-accepting chemotaxis protein
VRNLAQRSAGAAKEIKGLINDSVEAVGQGTKLVDETGKTFTELASAIEEVGKMIGDIDSAGKEQSAGIGEVSAAVSQMDEMTQQNAALVEEAAASSKSMEEQAQLLLEQIAFFTQETVEEKSPKRSQSRVVNRENTKQRPKPRLSAVEETSRPIFEERAKANLVNSDQEWEEF